MDGVPDFEQRILRAPDGVRRYLQARFAGLRGDERFLDHLEGHLPSAGRGERSARARAIVDALASR